MKMDINCDLGEGFGVWQPIADKTLMKWITTANIAAGFHASDPDTMNRTVSLAVEAGVQICVHPGYPDLIGFGRREISMAPQSIRNIVVYQLGALDAFARLQGSSVVGVKLHGALYHRAMNDPDTADAIVEGISAYRKDLVLVGLEGSAFHRSAIDFGRSFAREAFVDRAYHRNGTLVARSDPRSVITQPKECLRRVVQMIENHTVPTLEGGEIPVVADTLCIHSDTPNVIEILETIHYGLLDRGLPIRSWKAIE